MLHAAAIRNSREHITYDNPNCSVEGIISMHVTVCLHCNIATDLFVHISNVITSVRQIL